MKKFFCPSCGAEVVFRSNSTVCLVCQFCQSLLVRHDLKLEEIGKMAALKEDFSPLQIGSGGKFEGVNFTVIGRIVQKWEAGQWDEWYVLFDDQRFGWLGEAQGFFMMSFEQEGASLPAKESLRPGGEVKIGKNTLRIDDIKAVTCVTAQGELPHAVQVGRKATSVDVSAPDKVFGSLDYSAEGNSFFLGKYVEFDEFHFSFLRAIDGW